MNIKSTISLLTLLPAAMLSACGNPIESQTQTTADELRASSSRMSPRSSICARRRGACVEVRIGRNSTVHTSATQAFEYLLEYRLAGGDLRDTVIVAGARLGRAETMVANDFHNRVMEHTFSENDWQNDTNIIDSLMLPYNESLRFDPSIFAGASPEAIRNAMDEIREIAMAQSTRNIIFYVASVTIGLTIAGFNYINYLNQNGKYGPYGDLDGDGRPNNVDPDIDGDGINNDEDVDPYRAEPQVQLEEVCFGDGECLDGEGEEITAESETGRMPMMEFIYNYARDYQKMMRGYGY